jgi:hypothetical protein
MDLRFMAVQAADVVENTSEPFVQLVAEGMRILPREDYRMTRIVVRISV